MGPMPSLAAACASSRGSGKLPCAEYHEIPSVKICSNRIIPPIYAVSKASSRAPRLIDIRWGDKRHPKVTLVGKGVCFDSGGLDIENLRRHEADEKGHGRRGMRSGARADDHEGVRALPVRLRVLIPAVGEIAFPATPTARWTVYRARVRASPVEIGNTDAEGRIILCDALFEADQEKPELLIDCATLTGAARTALGTDIPALFTPDDMLAEGRDYCKPRSIARACDPLWRLPLWQGYRDMLSSQVADINSAPDSAYAGAITAALYLKEFVTRRRPFRAHIDMMAWNLRARPGRPVGAEAMAVRALC